MVSRVGVPNLNCGVLRTGCNTRKMRFIISGTKVKIRLKEWEKMKKK